MKLGRVVRPTPDGPRARIVAVQPDSERVIDLAQAYALTLQRSGAEPERASKIARSIFPSSMAAAIGGGDVFLDAAHDALETADDASLPLLEVQWCAAVDSPVIRDGLTFSQHIINFSEKVTHALPNPNIYKIPGYFKGSTATVYGHNEEIPYPDFTDAFDYELEIGYVVGRRGRNLTPDDALDHLFGITIFNDFSARDVQGAEMAIGMGPQKCKDFAYGIGPWITTMDEVSSIEGLTGSVRVNGETWSTCVAGDMVYTPAELVAYISIADYLQPGDLIGSGTLGFGSGLELGKTLSPGDVVELELESVGTLRSPISKTREKAPWWPEPRPYPFEVQDVN